MNYLGDFVEDATVRFMFNTFTSDDPSASSTITNFINTDVHIHKDNGLTQRNNAAGITVSVDFDGITGSHMIEIDTSDDTVGGFWATGSDYFVRIEGTTIDAGTVNATVGHFSIENRYNPVTDYDGPTNAEMVAAFTEIKGGTWAAGTDTLEHIRNKQTDIETDTAVIGALGAGLTAIPWNATWDAEVQSECADALTAYDPPTKAEMDTGHGLLATEAKQDIIDTNVDQIETAVITNAAGVDVAADIIAIKTETALIVADTNELQTDNIPGTLATIDGKIDTVDGIVDNILIDTGTTLDTLIKDIPTTAEFNARSLLSADYVVVGDTIAGVTTCTTNTDMRGTDGANTIVPDVAGTLATYDPPTKAEMDTAHALLATPAQVNTEVLDVINTDTFAEPGDENPAATTTLVNKIGYIFKFLRNKLETTSTRIHVYDDAGTNKDQSSTISDDGTTFTRGEFRTGDV